MLLSVTVPPDLLVDSGTPSLLHSTETVEDGGGLTLQGSTTVWPTKASTLDGSSLSMVTPPTVKLKTGQVRGQEEEGRTERRERLKKVQQSLYALLLELGLVATKESIKNAHNLGRSESGTDRRASEEPDRRDEDTFIHQTTSPFYQIQREGTHKRHEVRRDRTTDTPNVRKEPLLV